mmetsp:Transcript_102694/g.329174  ORF Transcript_102694/g.329174 Transcript_102694/m.329174 type:complete len:216 (+) Transcript_102694:603-1250(+)
MSASREGTCSTKGRRNSCARRNIAPMAGPTVSTKKRKLNRALRFVSSGFSAKGSGPANCIGKLDDLPPPASQQTRSGPALRGRSMWSPHSMHAPTMFPWAHSRVCSPPELHTPETADDIDDQPSPPGLFAWRFRRPLSELGPPPCPRPSDSSDDDESSWASAKRCATAGHQVCSWASRRRSGCSCPQARQTKKTSSSPAATSQQSSVAAMPIASA